MGNLAIHDSRSVRTIVNDTLGVDQLYAIMGALRGQYNRTTDRARRSRMRKVIDFAANSVVNDFHREDSD